MNGPPASDPDAGTVRVQMSGRGPDLFKVLMFLEAVLRRGDVDTVLADLGLSGIEIAAERSRSGRRLNLTLRLIEAAR